MTETDWLKKDIYDYAVRANGSKNCPNCGAPIEDEKCLYCGTRFIDFAAMDADEPFFMKIKHDGEVFIVKVKLNSASMSSETLVAYIDRVTQKYVRGATEIDMNFTVIG